MRQPEFPLDPELVAELEAIDDTLSGRLVAPEFAELAELTVMVAAERPQLAPARALELDQRVLRTHGSPESAAKPKRSWRIPGWAAGLSVAAAAAVVAVVAIGPGGGSSGTAGNGVPTPASQASSGSGSASAGSSSSAGTSSSAQHSGVPQRASKAAASSPPNYSGAGVAKGAPSSSGGSVSLNATPPITTSGSTAAASTPAPTPNARKTIQSAQLQLSASGRWVDAVAQEVFDVIGQEKGIVRSSQVTAASSTNGYATFNLSIPSSNLSDAVTRLSALAHARVISRTDGTQDVNGQYLSDQRHLADAKALRTSLLKQLAKATTQAQILSLQARIHDVESQISSDEATLHRLQYQIGFSQLYVTINAGSVPFPVASSSHSSGGFTIGKAAHDALHVLTVAAGVALIVLAALVPLGLVIALGVWVSLALRRRRREHALDTA